jgi:hypothetical protein
MRASDLIGREVVDARGVPVGAITDLRCVQDGPLRGTNAALRVDALLVSRHHAGSVLGYDRRRQGPLIVRLIVRRLHKDLRIVPWTDIADEGPPIRLVPGALEQSARP